MTKFALGSLITLCGMLFSADAPRVGSLTLEYMARVKNIPAGT